MRLFMIVFIFVTIKGAFFHILAYFPFYRQLRFPIWTVMPIISITQLLYSSVYTYHVVNRQSTGTVDLFFAVIWLVLFFLQIRFDRWKILFLYIFALDYALAIQGLSLFISSAMLKGVPLEIYLICAADLTLKFQILTAPFLLLLLKRTQVQIFQIQAPYIWKTIWILPAFMTLIVIMYTNNTSEKQVLQVRFLCTRLLLIFGMLLVCYILRQTLHMVSREKLLQQETAHQKALLSLEQKQYRHLFAQMQETRQARHDLKQHIRVIRNYLKTGSRESLQDYISHYAQALPEETIQIYCQNYAVNTIVNVYGMKAEENGIDFYTELNLPDQVPVEEPDLCCVLGNLLENALDACAEYGKEERPFIRVISKTEQDRLLLTVENICKNGPALSEDGQFQSGKHPGYGVGISSVCAIAARYRGNTEFHYENHVFHASVLLCKKRQNFCFAESGQTGQALV